MKFKTTLFFLVNFIIPIIVGGYVAKMVGQNCVVTWIPSILPCWIWNVLVVAFAVAALLDIIIYFVLPKIIKSEKVNIKIQEYRFPNYLQATKVGIFIENKSERAIIPFAKILGDIKQTEYFDDRSEENGNIQLPKNNRIIGININVPIADNDTGELIFVEVINNENVSLLVKHQLLIKSFYSVRSGDYKSNRKRWDFVFELYGKVNGKQFKNGIYSIFIETYMRNDEVFVQIGEIKTLV